MGFIPDSFIGVWQHRRAWVPFINRRAIEMRFSCGNSSSGEKAFSVFVQRFEHRSTKINSESKSRGSFLRTWKCDANIEASTSEKDFFIQRLSLDSQKWKWKWYKTTESIMSILSKWTLSSLPNFKEGRQFQKACDHQNQFYKSLWWIPLLMDSSLSAAKMVSTTKNVIKFQKMSVHLRPKQAQKAFQ